MHLIKVTLKNPQWYPNEDAQHYISAKFIIKAMSKENQWNEHAKKKLQSINHECVMLFLANRNIGKALEQEWKISGLTFMIPY